MGWFSDDSDQAQAAQWVDNQDQFQPEHEAKLSHELVGGAASFMAMRAYEEHEQREGKPTSHALAKELAVGFAGAMVDRIAETKGEDFYDREKAKRHARDQVSQAVDQEYGYQN